MRSPSTCPGPMEGSCAGSPTSSRWVPSWQASSSAAVSSTSSMEASSTTTTSASSGHSSLRANPPEVPCAPSSRCTVTAGWSVSSSSRLAARPVGAASATSLPLDRSRLTIAATVRLLPVPGPPVSSDTPAPSTWATAAFCASSSPLATDRTAAGSAIRSAVAASRTTFSATASSAIPYPASDSVRIVVLVIGVLVELRLGRLVLQHLTGVHGGDDRRGRVGDLLGAQGGDHQVGGEHGVPVAGRRPQGHGDDRPPAAGVLPVGTGQ